MAVTNPPLLGVTARIGAAKFKFILDTGAKVSILPRNMLKGLITYPTGISLSSATGDKIPTYGEARVQIEVKELRRSYEWKFIVAETTHALLGIDFLTYFNMLESFVSLDEKCISVKVF